jgi:hypothetical protein
VRVRRIIDVDIEITKSPVMAKWGRDEMVVRSEVNSSINVEKGVE